MTRKQSRDKENSGLRSPPGMLGPTDGLCLASVEPGSDGYTKKSPCREHLSFGLLQIPLRVVHGFLFLYLPPTSCLLTHSKYPASSPGLPESTMGCPATGSELGSAGPGITPYAVLGSLAEGSYF